MTKSCKICKRAFKTIPSLIKLGGGKYCSYPCSYIGRKTGKTVSCIICSKKFWAFKCWTDSGQGKHCSRKCLFVTMKTSRLGEQNPMWKGDNVGLNSLHQWVRSRLVKPLFCQNCKKVPPYDLANISQVYKRDLSDWEWLCRKCHMVKDNRMLNLQKGQSLKHKRDKTTGRFLN